MGLEEYLNSKPLYYDDIDYNNVNEAWLILKHHINIPYVIHIIGTNGKGSTGRFLSSFLVQQGKNTLHYSSPHIVEFNERIWIDGSNSTNLQLDIAHKQLQNLLPDDLIKKLTYFEYTTLIALLLSSNMDYIVLEAGLGGEFDATNVVRNDLTLITTIGLDHTEFLGDTIEKIASTKMRSCDTQYILGYQVSNMEVNNAKKDVLNDRDEIVYNSSIVLPKDANKLPVYLKNNLRLALSALEFLDLETTNLKLPKLFGRCQQYKKNTTLDVGHNTLAATVLLREFLDKKINLVYNSYSDKDYASVLMILKPIIHKLHIINIEDKRIAKTQDIEEVCDDLNIEYCNFEQINNSEEYLVFGSFKVVEEFLNKTGSI